MKIDPSRYERKLREYLLGLKSTSEDRAHKGRALDPRKVRAEAAKLVPKARDLHLLGTGKSAYDTLDKLSDLMKSSDYDQWEQARKVFSAILTLESSYDEPLDVDKEYKSLQTATMDFMKGVVSQVQAAIKRVPVWHGSPVVVSPMGGEDLTRAASYYEVKIGKRDASFTVFGDREIDDILDSGDREFFRTPEEESDYFSLVKEMQKPGSSSKGKKIVLYTARPTKDREFYLRTRTLPSGVFLTTDESRAYGIAHDLGGREVRDVWKVVTDDAYLIQTLGAGRTKDYQVVREAPAKLVLISEGLAKRA